MVLVEKIIKEAIEKDASDIHFIGGLKPILRISRELVTLDKYDVIDETELYDIYDYIVKGNVERSEEYKTTRKLDTFLVFNDIRLRVNCSYSNDLPVFTMRIIKNTLPSFEELGVPEVVRTMTYQAQGLILVTGKTNSGKTTTLNCLIDDINEKQKF